MRDWIRWHLLNYVLTSDPRMESYYEGWREAACNLDPRVRQ